MDEKYLVVINREDNKEDIVYMGGDIMKSYKRLKELSYVNKEYGSVTTFCYYYSYNNVHDKDNIYNLNDTTYLQYSKRQSNRKGES
ncbi:MAG TPA: hypothetical protein VIM42_09300 [Clostridium sp.]